MCVNIILENVTMSKSWIGLIKTIKRLKKRVSKPKPREKLHLKFENRSAE